MLWIRLERLNLTLDSDKTLAVMSCGVFRIANGKIAQAREYFDLTTVLRQLGVEKP